MSIVLSDHVRHQAARRGIDQAIVRAVAEAPEQAVRIREGRRSANRESHSRRAAYYTWSACSSMCRRGSKR